MKQLFITLLTIAGFALAQGPVATTFLWDGNTDTEGKVETGSDEETAGYWYDYNDANDGGSSAFTFPADVEENAYSNFFGPLIEAYGGIKASISLGAGCDYPYAGIGFNVWSEGQEGVDITAWSGICLTYQSTLGFGIELGVEDEATVTEYNNYKATVAKAGSLTATDFAWAKFKQGTGWGKTIPIETALGSTAAIKLKFEGVGGTTGDFLIKQVGSLGQCSVGPNAIPESNVKKAITINDDMIVATGATKIEVFDLTGKSVVSTDETTLKFDSFKPGVYVIRATGKNLNFVKQIQLH